MLEGIPCVITDGKLFDRSERLFLKCGNHIINHRCYECCHVQCHHRLYRVGQKPGREDNRSKQDRWSAAGMMTSWIVCQRVVPIARSLFVLTGDRTYRLFRDADDRWQRQNPDKHGCRKPCLANRHINSNPDEVREHNQPEKFVDDSPKAGTCRFSCEARKKQS